MIPNIDYRNSTAITRKSYQLPILVMDYVGLMFTTRDPTAFELTVDYINIIVDQNLIVL